MRITRVSIYSVDLPTKGGSQRRRERNSPAANASTIVEIETDAGVSGLGEVCPIGTYYMRGWADAARVGIPYIARMILGEDPFAVERLNRHWDDQFKDDLYVKAPVDMALWDIMGKATGRPICDLLGGRCNGQAPLYRSVYLDQEAEPADHVERCREIRSEGFRHFQLKPNGDPARDIAMIEAVCDILEPGEAAVVDANGAWTLAAAVKVANAVRNLPVVIEQPCRTMEECISFRRHCPLPVKLDEVMETPQDVIRAFEAGAMDMVAIKIARVGGLTKARRMRDLCLDLGLMVVPDDAWGSEIVSSAVLHLAASTWPKLLSSYTDLTDYVTVSTADGYPVRRGGSIVASQAPGLGLELRRDVAGKPVAVIE
jgi:L-alanine-DL-glutamate epimerase-like enolase superfamily enzyme